MFLEWVEQQQSPDLVRKLNAKLRAGSFDDSLWTSLTGKSVDELWQAFIASVREPS
jgi:hypothetical protein